MRIRLRSTAGAYLSSRHASDVSPISLTTAPPSASEEFWLVADTPRIRSGSRATLRTVALMTGPLGLPQPVAAGYVTTTDPRGRPNDRLFVQEHFLGSVGDDFLFTRLDNDGMPLADGDRVALRFVETARPGWLSTSTGVLRIAPGEVPGPGETFFVETMSELKLFWNGALADNFSTATGWGVDEALAAGYGFVRVQGRVWMNPGPGRRPLVLFRHAGRGDNLLAATDEGERDALADGYARVRLEGYVQEKPGPGLLPLRTYWSGPGRDDSFAATIPGEEQNAADAGYAYLRDEGFVLPPAPPSPGAIDIVLDDGRTARLRLDRMLLPDPRHLVHVVRPRRMRGGGKRALVLSGGGAKGCFEVGAVRRLWEGGYRPDIVCGVSVGALNAAKLAERRDSSAEELASIWEELSPARSGGRAVHSRDYFTNLVLGWAGHMAFDGIDDLVGGTNIMNWFMYAAAHLHAIHSMRPLRDLIRRHLNPGAISDAGTQLRIGVTDLQTGQYFSVTEPIAPGVLGLNVCGAVEVEPDHRQGETWLTRPIFGADGYAISLEDAVYSSCVLPVFMDPRVVNLRTATPLPYGDQRLVLLRAVGEGAASATYSPPAVERLMRATRGGQRPVDGALFSELKAASGYDLGRLQRESTNAVRGDARMSQHHLFDGGLRDTIAIRTAIRLGAREVTVITGDRLQAARWAFRNPGGIATDMQRLPVAQYLFGLLGTWFNEAARSDMLLAVAHNEFLGWLYRCFSLMDEAGRRQILREFDRYWASHGLVLRDVLGGSTWLGGDVVQAYGVPFMDEGCSIRYIAPDGDLLDPLAFDDWNGIREGMEMGYEAARSPVDLSFPVPDARVETAAAPTTARAGAA